MRPNIDQLAKEVHVLNHKWWHDINTGELLNRNKGELSMLIVSELAEAMEGERKDLMDDKLPHRKMAEVECADTVIRVLDIMGKYGYQFTVDTEVIAAETENRAEYLYGIVGVLTVGPWMGVKANNVFSGMIISLENYCYKFGYDLWAAVTEKLEYNKHREDHKAEVRAMAGGKKW